MKINYSVLLIFSFLVFSCSSDSGDEGTNEPLIQTPIPTAASTSYKGDFVSVAHPTGGVATIDKDKKKLTLTNFFTDAGPILDVYLATDGNATEYITLGTLKGLKGNFDYEIPDNTDIDKLNYVVIWCVDFKINFGHAILSKVE